ncbi:MAG: CocE/NonD family hydrolase [Atopobiaceae bacterium]|nr:CocE/NonD family hydrolase [Atopobiaceae bacterium]
MAASQKTMTHEETAIYLHECYERCVVPAIHGGFSVEETMIRMDDGVRLRTVIYKPEGCGNAPLPLVYVRSCYPSLEVEFKAHAEEYAKRGFAFAYQYCRGTGGSEGIWEPNTVAERTDGLTTAEWFDSQDWVASMGYWGNSYMAMCGWAIIDSVPEKMKTMYLTHYGTDRYASLYESGLFRQDIMTGWAMSNAGFPIDADYLASCAYRPQLTVDTDLWGAELPWYRRWISSTQRDDPCWHEGLWEILRHAPEGARIPILLGEAWFDHHFGSAMHTYEALSEESKAHSTLLVGCWEHNFMPCLEGHPQEHIDNNDCERAIVWFQDILMEGMTPERRIRFYTIGEDTWKDYGCYPMPDAGELRLYLTDETCPDGFGSSRKLSSEAPASASELVYDYDPLDPVPSIGGESVFTSKEQRGSVLQPACGWRDDVLSFRSDPLPCDTEVVGRMTGELWVRSSAPDTSFTVRISEEMPDGRAYNIRSGIATLAFRDGSGVRGAYSPGETVCVRIPTWDVCWTPRKGSRIRVDVSSSNFPEYSVHGNAEGGWAEQAETSIATQTILAGGDHASCIVFPLANGNG